MRVSSVRAVVEGGFCVGCGGCAFASGGAISMRLGEFGAYEPDLDQSSGTALDAPSALCPFSDAAKNEDELARRFAPAVPHRDPRLGYYSTLAAGRISDERRITDSSSGGLTSWILEKLLAEGLVDGVIHVGPLNEGPPSLFGYTLSYSAADLAERRKSIYYSTHMADALSRIVGDGRRYAFVGVPCFVKAVSLLMAQDERLAGQIAFRIGLVCGHLKSAAFAECMGWQAGIPPDRLAAVDFRVKDPEQPANHYRFGARSVDGGWQTLPTSQLLGGNWGHGMFQLGACDFCDDIFAETADLCLGDAWLPQYDADWRGTNIVLSRNAGIDELLTEGRNNGEILLDDISADLTAQSQAGNFRHRWDGLSVRLADDVRRGQAVPRKRIAPGSRPVPWIRRQLVRLRRKMSRTSHTAFAHARAEGDLDLFREKMMPLVKQMKRLYRIEKAIVKRPPLRWIARWLGVI